MTLLIGQSIGRYKIIEQLGEGGMATVYKAFDTRLERNVAVKLIRYGAFAPELVDRILQRFDREAKALAKLSHPNIVRVLDYGDYEGSPYLVMEFLPGGTLKYLMGKPMPWQEAVRLILPIVRALQYAHEQNIVHRDIKPSNILLTEKAQQPMLSDFGIAKILEDEENANLTGTGMGIGTPEYMAPEQWIGQGGPQSDLYSLGVVLYELVTGRNPYTANTPAAILLKQANEPLPSPGQFAPGLPGGVEQVLLKTLAKDIANRYQNMGELSAALEGLLIADAGQARQVDLTSQVAPRKVESIPQVEQTLVPNKSSADDFDKTLSFKPQKQYEQSPVIPPPVVNPPPKPRPASRRWIGWAIGGGLGIILLAGILLGIGYLTNRSKNQVAQESTPTPVVNTPTPEVAILGQPTGTLTSWDRSFNWTGVSGATDYFLELQTSTGAALSEYKFIAADICTGTTCSVTLAGLILPDGGSYQWRILFSGPNVREQYTDFQNFTLPVAVLGLPSGTLTSWDGSFRWTGVAGATSYYWDIQTPAGDIITGDWYTAADVCTGTTCSIVTPVGLNLLNGSYQWRIQDYGAYGYGVPTGFQNFTLDIPLSVTVLGQPSGKLSSWDKSFNWTGVAGATYYIWDLQTSDGNIITGEWFKATDVCTGTTCSVTPVGLKLLNRSYQWRIQDYGAYGNGLSTSFQTFTLTLP